MKIAMFTNEYKPMRDSGVVNAIEAYHLGLSRLKQEVHIIAPKFPNYKDKVPNVYRYPSINLPMKTLYPLPIPYSLKISKLVRKSKFDIIHTHHPFGLGKKGCKFARKYSIPLVFTNHTMYQDYSHYIPLIHQNLAKKIIKDVHKKYLSLCDCIIAPSQYIKNKLLKIVTNSRIEVIPYGLNHELLKNYKKSNIRRLYHLENKKIILFLGRLGKEKNISFIIKSFKFLSKKRNDAVLVICGRGHEEKNLKNLIRNLQIQDKVSLVGNIPYSEIENYYTAADIFITASTTETGPLTVLESLFFGVPVICLKNSNMEDKIKNGYNGFLVERSIKSFSEKIEELLSNESLLKQLSRNAKKSSRKYDVLKVSKKLLSLYKSLL